MHSQRLYALVTAAKNEGAFIARTMESVTRQKILPTRWVTVSDSSTDGTDEIMKQYAARHDFIKYLRVESSAERSFHSKVMAVRAGMRQLENIPYAFVGNLDADISLEDTYYETILSKFEENPRLGIAGGMVCDAFAGKVHPPIRARNTVQGCIQLFRRQCYEDIGGYHPFKYACEDAVAVIMARMSGWEVRSFDEPVVLHGRRMGTHGTSIWRARLLEGEVDFVMGSDPIFQLVKCIYRTAQRPYVVSGMLRLSGYLMAAAMRKPLVVPAPFVRYLRREQRQRLFAGVR